jgi:hypothetical protein
MNLLFADLRKSATTSQKSKHLRQLSFISQLLVAYNVSSRSQLEEPNRECNTLFSVNPVAEYVSIPTSSLLISCLLCPVLADTAGFCRKPKKEVEEEEEEGGKKRHKVGLYLDCCCCFLGGVVLGLAWCCCRFPRQINPLGFRISVFFFFALMDLIHGYLAVCLSVFGTWEEIFCIACFLSRF